MGRIPLQPVSKNALNVRKTAKGDDAATKDTHMEDWRRQWRQILAHSVVVFDGIKDDELGTVKDNLTLLGTRFQAFFERNVTHVITKRPTDVDYPRHDIIHRAKVLGMRVWTVEKLIKFLTALLGRSPMEALDNARSTKLAKMLERESVVGLSERDPSVRRDDYYYFKGPYVLVWDPSHHNRTIVHREWGRWHHEAEEDWPKLQSTVAGACPFAPAKAQSGVKRTKQVKCRETRRRVSVQESGSRLKPRNRESTSRQEPDNEQPTEHEGLSQKTNPAPKQGGGGSDERSSSKEDVTSLPVKPLATMSANCVNARANNNSQSNKPDMVGDFHGRFFEIAASGIQRGSTTSAVKSTTTQSGEIGNGLGLAQTFSSREVANLQRKVLERPLIKPSVQKPSKTSKPPGFCENCLERFTNFDEHIRSKRHRIYAANASNFEALDSIIALLRRRSVDGQAG